MIHGFGYNCFGNFGGYGWLGMILNLIFVLIVILGIIWFAIWLTNRMRHNTSMMDTPSAMISPIEILQARYARGEINREQYLEILNDLK